jgi:hypothetical protein
MGKTESNSNTSPTFLPPHSKLFLTYQNLIVKSLNKHASKLVLKKQPQSTKEGELQLLLCEKDNWNERY